MPIDREAEEIIRWMIKLISRDRIIVNVTLYSTQSGWKVKIYDEKEVLVFLGRIFPHNNNKKTGTNKKYPISNFKFFLLSKTKDHSIELLPLNVTLDKLRTYNKKSIRDKLKELKKLLNFLLQGEDISLDKLKELLKVLLQGNFLQAKLKKLNFLISFSRYTNKEKSKGTHYIFIFFSIKKDVIKKGEQELYEVIVEFLDSKELKSYIKQFTGMKEQEFKEKLGYEILYGHEENDTNNEN